MTETIETLYWAVMAVVAYWLMFFAVVEAFKPKPLPDPDWFWNGGYWVPTEQPTGLVHGEYGEVKPEQSDRPESKPESGAG